MRVLVACEFSGVVRRAFRAAGHDAWSCDLLESEDGSPFHLQGDVLKGILSATRWDLLIAHPPCTYLTNSGVRWLHEADDDNPKCLKGRPRFAAMREAAAFFNAMRGAPVERIAVENPIMHYYAYQQVGVRATQFVQPWQFGTRELKATGFHLKNLPPLKPTKVLEVPVDPVMRKHWARVHRASPSPDRWKERSRTDPGIAAAMADQWGSL